MKWIGQNIYDFISRFRNDVYLESPTAGGSDPDKFLGIDSDGKIIYRTGTQVASDIGAITSETGDISAVTAGVGLSGGGTTGAVTLTVDLSEFSGVTPANGDSLATLDSDGSTEQLTSIADLATLFAGTGLTASSSVINVDAAQSGITSVGTLTGLTIDGDKNVTPGDGAMLHIDRSTVTDASTSASGTASLYTHARIEGPTLAATNASVTTTNAAALYVTRPVAGTNQTITNNYGIYTNGETLTNGLTNTSNYEQTAGEMRLYDATNDGNPTISLGSSSSERLEIQASYESGAQGLDVVKFTTYTAGSSTNDGRFSFYPDEVLTFQIRDHGINLAASKSLQINGTDIISDSSGTATLSNIDALDATTESTIESAIDTLSNLTTVGTIGTGVWNGTKITDIYTNSSGKRYGNTIKILPSDFMINDDAASPLSFKDGSNSGVHVNDAASEAVAFVTIPEGMKATHVDVYATHNRTLKVWEVDLNASFDFTSTTIGTGACNTQLDITDVNATATNYLAVQVALSATTQRIWGGIVTIAAQ